LNINVPHVKIHSIKYNRVDKMRKVLEDGKLPLNEMNSLRYLVASAGPLKLPIKGCGSIA